MNFLTNDLTLAFSIVQFSNWSIDLLNLYNNLPATFYSFANGCKLVNIQHQSWWMAYQKYQNVSHKNRCHLIFHSSPFGIGFGLRFSQNWTPTALLIHGICSRNLSIILKRKILVFQTLQICLSCNMKISLGLQLPWEHLA